MKNLKVFKGVLPYAVAGIMGLSAVQLIDFAETTNDSAVEVNNEHNGKTDEVSGTPLILEQSIDSLIKEDKQDIKSNINDENQTNSFNKQVEVTAEPVLPTATPTVIETYPKNTYGYIVKELNLRKGPNKKKKKVAKLNMYQTVKLLEKEGDWILAKSEGKKGYIYSGNVKELKDEFVDIDISDQKLKLYDEDGDKVLESSIVSGTEVNSGKRSDRGAFEVFYKGTKRYLEGPGYKSWVDYFAAYNNGEGMHDASWRSNFGGEIYKYNGSHGCINLPVSVAPKVYKNVKIGTKVIVHD